ncbi:MAG TPA: hypothetical protein VKM55_07135 [Candidatus Lokiarchaeia archaeon]|nr:hypothetical protein [Candidatus Lokiarchaeia archaeon]
MKSIPVEKDVLVDLVDSKLRLINQDIQQILEKWNYKSATTFLYDARNGELKEAEDDAVCMRNLLDDRDALLVKKEEWSIA